MTETAGDQQQETLQQPPIVVTGDGEPEAVKPDDKPDDKPAEKPAEKPAAEGKKPWFMHRIDTLTGQIAEERAANQRTLDLLEKLHAERVGAVKPDAPAGSVRPKLDQFDSYEDYQEALLEFKLNERMAREADEKAAQEREREGADKTRSVSEQINAAKKDFQKQQSAFAAKTPDYEDVISSVQIPASDSMMYLMSKTGAGPQVLYHLAKNIPEAERIYDLPYYEQAIAIGKIASRFDAGTESANVEKQNPSVSGAPRPPTPVRGAAPDSDAPSDDDDTETWLRKERQRLRRIHGQNFKTY